MPAVLPPPDVGLSDCDQNPEKARRHTPKNLISGCFFRAEDGARRYGKIPDRDLRRLTRISGRRRRKDEKIACAFEHAPRFPCMAVHSF
jgi:hypothetical protein